MFRAEALSRAELGKLVAAEFESDVVRPAGREIYVWYRNGMSGTKTAEKLGRWVTTTATDRNWNTVLKLLALTQRG
jgi:uncharacterized protein (DUF1697 family)